MINLPEAYQQDTIGKMKVGETGYTVPWAMYQENECLMINTKHVIRKSTGGTAQMKVTRLNMGYEIDIRQCENHQRSKDSGPVGDPNGALVERLITPQGTIDNSAPPSDEYINEDLENLIGDIDIDL